LKSIPSENAAKTAEENVNIVKKDVLEVIAKYQKNQIQQICFFKNRLLQFRKSFDFCDEKNISDFTITKDKIKVSFFVKNNLDQRVPSEFITSQKINNDTPTILIWPQATSICFRNLKESAKKN
jgi:hypothetical protein